MKVIEYIQRGIIQKYRILKPNSNTIYYVIRKLKIIYKLLKFSIATNNDLNDNKTQYTY